MNVRPILNEVGRYAVESRSKTDTPEHLCDILSDECGCRDWVCNHREKGPHYRCAHLKAARAYAFEDYLSVMREISLSR